MSKKNIEQENETEKVSNKPAQTAAPESAPQPPEDPEKNHRGPAGKIVLTVFLAIAIVAGVSFMPLERWTGGRVKNFSLIRDILPDSLLPSDSASTGETVDPELLKAEAVAKNLDAQGNPLYTDTIIGEPQPSQVNGQTVIEDYTDGSVGLYHLRRAIADPRRARIAVVGDSYIEGDIMTQDLREMLQGAYGGTGTGYMSMYSAFPGFRRSVRQGRRLDSPPQGQKERQTLYLAFRAIFHAERKRTVDLRRGEAARPSRHMGSLALPLHISGQHNGHDQDLGQLD